MKSIMAKLPWDHVAVDLVTPLPMSKNGEDTLLVAVDIMSKFCILRTLKGKGMATIAATLWEIMAIFGMPKIIQSDNGAEFVNQLIKELVALNGIDHRTISPYNPRANGQVERTNQVVEAILKKELQGAMHDWADFVPYTQLAYNSKISSVTGCTPFSLMFGRRLNDFRPYGKSTSSGMSLQLWQEHQKKVSSIVYPAVNERILQAKGKSSLQFDNKHRILHNNAFPQGSLVMMLDSTRESKWDPVFEGPFVVVRRNRGGAYVLKDQLGETLKRTVPADKLKLVQRKGNNAVIEAPSYRIKNITDHRTASNKKMEYFVVWADKNIESSWEPVENFDDVNVIKKYWAMRRPTRSSRPQA